MPNAASIFRAVPKAVDKRPCASKRGYDAAWVRCSRLFLALPANKHCFYCKQRGVTTKATCVDHAKPFKGLNDPLRLSWSNLRASCVSCNTRKGYADRARQQAEDERQCNTTQAGSHITPPYSDGAICDDVGGCKSLGVSERQTAFNSHAFNVKTAGGLPTHARR